MRRLALLAVLVAAAAGFIALVATHGPPDAASGPAADAGPEPDAADEVGPPASRPPTAPDPAARVDARAPAGTRTAASLEAVDDLRDGAGRLEIRVRYPDGAAVDGEVPVTVLGGPTERLVRVAGGGPQAIELDPGAYDVRVAEEPATSANQSWLPTRPRSRASVTISEGESSAVELTVTRTGTLVATVTGDAHLVLIPIRLYRVDSGYHTGRPNRGSVDGRELSWTRLHPGEYELRGSCLPRTLAIEVAAEETRRVTVHPAIARVVAHVRVMASDGSGPYAVPARVSMERRVTFVDREGVERTRTAGTKRAIAHPGEPARPSLAPGRYRVHAEPLDGRSFITKVAGRTAERSVELTAPGEVVELELTLEVDAPRGLSVLEFEVEGRGDVWLHASDRSHPPLRVVRRGIGAAVALDIASYGDGTVELTDSAEPGEGEVIRVEALTPGMHTWRLLLDD